VIPRFPVYLFDVDGTLLDSATDICESVQAALAPRLAQPLSMDFLKQYIGHHLFDLFRDVLPDYDDAQGAEILKHYRSIYLSRGHRATRVYDGVPAMLERLGGRKSTATTKSSETARNILTQFGLAAHFEHVQGTDGFPAKPKPDVIYKSFEALNVRAEECLLVGDSGPDMAAGRAAGVKTCAVLYGYGTRESLAPFEPDYWIEHPDELL
jgi:phosphoglycolate phosphatase